MRPAVYSELVAGWAQLEPGMTAWDLYGGAGVFAAVLADGVGERRQGRHRGHVTRCVAIGPCGAGRPRLGVGGDRLGAPGAGGADRSGPTSPCWTRRGPGPGVR